MRLLPVHAIVLIVVACAQPQGGFTADSIVLAAGNCPPSERRPPFSGSLEGRRDSVIAFATKGPGLYKPRNRDVGHQSRDWTITPICRNHAFTLGDLVDGRFVAVITVQAQSPFSSKPNDTVAWWVYGAQMSDSQVVLRSEFVSLTAANDQEFLIKAPFSWCDEDSGDEETGGWHGAACHAAAARPPGGDNPWFGCKLGCCFAVKPLDER